MIPNKQFENETKGKPVRLRFQQVFEENISSEAAARFQ